MHDPGNPHPSRGLRRRSRPGHRPRPRLRSHGALEVWSVRVLRQVRIAPHDRGAGATRKALRSPKEHGLIVSSRPGGEPLYKMAALWVASRRLPGMTQRKVLPIASIPGGGYNRPIELPNLEMFRGAACYQPIELPGYKAARPTKPPGVYNDGAKSGSPPGVRSAQPGACLQRFCVPSSSFKRSGGRFIRSKVRSTSKLSQAYPGKHVNSSIQEPNASTFSELLVHSAPFSTL
jgi:hypothetical protein